MIILPYIHPGFEVEFNSQEISKREIRYSEYKEENYESVEDIKPKLSENEKQGYCLACDELFDDLQTHESLNHGVNIIVGKCDICGKTCGVKRI